MDAARRTLHTRVTQARELRVAGDYPAAAAGLRHAITEAERVCGPAAVDLVVPLNELGMVGKYSGAFDEAEQAYTRALAIHADHGEMDSPDVAAILHNLGGLAHARGDARTAERWARQGIAVRAALPESDPVARGYDDAALAAILIDLGQFAEARAILTSVLASYERAGARHVGDVAVARHNLGSVEFREGRFAEAAANLRRARAIKRAVLGRRHPDLAATLYNLARCQERLGRASAARRNLRRAIKILVPVAAPAHPTLVACRRRLDALCGV